MPNLNAPVSPKFKGLYFDQLNGRVELYYNGTLLKSWSATSETVGAQTVDFTGATSVSLPTANRIQVSVIGSAASLASNGASGAILPDLHFVAPYNLRIVSAWAMNQTKSDVTVGTATSSASYRRINLVTNTAGTGSGTDIVASLNATASAASLATRAFTTVASTVPAGAIVLASQLTVGAATADGTDVAERLYSIAYIAV